ncbi:MAG: M23 family metallopeptidase [Sulfurospirillum sp.]|nr:M23 family metallopeptidase [Sulfurospirillum sp.]
MRKCIFLALFCVNTLFGLDVFVGKTTIITLEQIDLDAPVYLEDMQIFSQPNPKNKKEQLLLIAIDYKSKLGEQTIRYMYNKSPREIRLHVRDVAYKSEKLQVIPDKVSPPKKYQDIIYEEYKEAMDIYKLSTPNLYWSEPFVYPLESQTTSDFGNARVFNGSLKSYHSGIDFKAAIATPVKASNDGIVVLAKERYYAGGSVIIDHGFGVYSCYFHLSDFAKKVGDAVKRGEIIGLSGQSGRVTGPHLHFAFKIRGTSTDPLDFIKKINALVANK